MCTFDSFLRKSSRFKLDSNDSRQYLLMLQNIITRMASNSTNCKVWTVTISTGMMAMMIAAPSLRRLLILSCLPIMLFYFLDSYYLGLEKSFRNLQNEYVKKLRSQESDFTNSIYNFNIRGIEENKGNFKKALKSVATWPMYLILFIVVIFCSVVIWKAPDQTTTTSFYNIVEKDDAELPVKASLNTYNKSFLKKTDKNDSAQVRGYGNK